MNKWNYVLHKGEKQDGFTIGFYKCFKSGRSRSHFDFDEIFKRSLLIQQNLFESAKMSLLHLVYRWAVLAYLSKN